MANSASLNPEVATDREEEKAKTTSSLRPVDVEVINLFVQFSAALGQPRSIAQIYGLLFMSEDPLCLEDIIGRLSISRGAGNQGLNYLQSLGAVRTVYLAGRRRIHYEAVAELRKIAARFIQHQVQRHFQGSEERLESILNTAKQLPGAERAHALARAKMLKSWEKNIKRVAPLVVGILGPAKT